MSRRSLFSTSQFLLVCCATLLTLSLFAGNANVLHPNVARAATFDVETQSYQFVPATVSISVGDTITWTNTSTSIHDAVSNDNYFNSGDLVENNPAKRSFSYTFTQPGTYQYICSRHADAMKGTIIVGSGATSTATVTRTPTVTQTATSTPTGTQSATSTVTSTPTGTQTTPTATATPTAATTPTTAPLPRRYKAYLPEMIMDAPRIPTGERWSDPQSWGGRLPQAGEAVLIPAGQNVLLDTTPPTLTSLQIDGTLSFADQAGVGLTVGWVFVKGQLNIGSEQQPYQANTSITLVGGTRKNDIDNMGSKFLAVRYGGRIEMHGARRDAVSWTRLATTAEVGESMIMLAEPVKWKIGDEIVIAPTGNDPFEAEKVTITAASDTMITFTPALKYRHWGSLQQIAGKSVDERATVGLLTRSIIIQSDEEGTPAGIEGYSYRRGFGGHLIIMAGGGAKIEGVELRRMGQTGLKGRYGGVHWHLVGDRAGDYFKNNSVSDSYHRGVVTHGTNNVLIEQNVVYNTVSQVFMPAEDGVETGNSYICNLGILMHQVAPADFAFGPDGRDGGQQEDRPGIFWLRNPNNPLVKNVAAGAVRGIGYFYDGGLIGSGFQFSENTANTISAVGSSSTDILDPNGTRGIGLLVTSGVTGTLDVPGGVLFQNFTAYKNTVAGVFLKSDRYKLLNAILADQPVGGVLFESSVANTLVVGQSANQTIDLTQPAFGKAGFVYMAGYGPKRIQLSSVSFIGFPGGIPAVLFADSAIAANSLTNGLTFSGVMPRISFSNAATTGAISDSDGSLANANGARRVAAQNISGGGCSQVAEVGAWVCNP